MIYTLRYFQGAKQPWRNGGDDTPVENPSVIQTEEKSAAQVIAEDATTCGTPAHADLLCARGVRVDWLLSLTWQLDIWHLKTWEVVNYLVKPATEDHMRCRFSDLPSVKPFTGSATVFMSHCWGGKWGDLVAAACYGASWQRIVWIDIFAVRQWPGNSADLDFRGVIKKCTAVIVAATPIPGLLSAEIDIYKPEVQRSFVASPEFAAAVKMIPFCRLWCIGEKYMCADLLRD